MFMSLQGYHTYINWIDISVLRYPLQMRHPWLGSLCLTVCFHLKVHSPLVLSQPANGNPLLYVCAEYTALL